MTFKIDLTYLHAHEPCDLTNNSHTEYEMQPHQNTHRAIYLLGKVKGPMVSCLTVDMHDLVREGSCHSIHARNPNCMRVPYG